MRLLRRFAPRNDRRRRGRNDRGRWVDANEVIEVVALACRKIVEYSDFYALFYNLFPIFILITGLFSENKFKWCFYFNFLFFTSFFETEN